MGYSWIGLKTLVDRGYRDNKMCQMYQGYINRWGGVSRQQKRLNGSNSIEVHQVVILRTPLSISEARYKRR